MSHQNTAHPFAPCAEEALASSVLRCLEAYGNYLPGALSAPEEDPRFRQACDFIRRQHAIEMVILGFPAKSPNRRKTYSDHADLGEVEGLRTLHRLCVQISEIYPPGARVHVCSDGHVFADLVHVPDATVDRFQSEIEAIIRSFDFHTLHTFSARSVYGDLGGDALRHKLVTEHAKDLATTRGECLQTPEGKTLWSGIHRFLFEDDVVRCPELSRNQVRDRSKLRAYEVIQRSQSFSNLVQSRFTGALRLSIHPQLRAAKKLGIQLVPSDDRWATPWHNVLVMTPDGARLMHRARAEELGAQLRFMHDKFAYFELTR